MSKPSRHSLLVGELLENVIADAKKESDPEKRATLVKQVIGLANAKSRLGPGKRKKKVPVTNQGVGGLLK